MKFIVVLQPKGWIATIWYMYSLYYTIRCNKKTLHKMSDAIIVKRQIKCY